MGWVDVIICLITQLLNKNSQPTWVDVEAGRTGESAASLSRGRLGRGGWRPAREAEGGWCLYPSYTPLLPPNGGGGFLGPAVSPSWSNSTSSFDGVAVGRGVLMRSPKAVQPTLMRSVADGSSCFERMKWNS